MRSTSASSCRWPTLSTSVKVVAVLEVLGCIALLIPLTLLMINILFGGVVGSFTEIILGVKKDLQFTLWCICWIILFINLILAIHLYRGVSKKSKVPFQIWLSVNGGVLIVVYLWSLMSINLFVVLDERVTAIAILIFGSLYRCSGILVVFKFLKKLNAENVEVFTITPSSPVILSSAETLRSEIAFHADTDDMYARPRQRPGSTLSTFESPGIHHHRTAELQAVDTNFTYPDLRHELKTQN